MNTSDLVHQLRLELWNVTYARYLSQELFSSQWWVIATFLVILYIVWWRFVDKRRLVEIMLFGSFVTVAAALFSFGVAPVVVGVGVTTMFNWSYS